MATPSDIFVEPALEIIQDVTLALKWSNAGLTIRFFS
jgi:hypothetical protein